MRMLNAYPENPCTLVLGSVKPPIPDKPTENVFWALQATDNPVLAEKIARLWACDCAEQVAHISGDWRTYEAIAVSRSFALGLVADERRSAAWSAARSAAESAARSAAESAAWLAARSAAWQVDRLKWYLERMEV